MQTNGYNTMMRDFANLANAVNRSFETSYDYGRNGGSSTPGSVTKKTLRLPVDAWSDENGFTFKAFLPGINPEDVSILFKDDELVIRGEFVSFHTAETNEEGEEAESTVENIRTELYHGPFERRFNFNTPVDAENISAEFENGVLTLMVPKAEEVKPKQITVKAK